MVIWVEMIGFAGSALAVVTYCMKTMSLLRVAAILSCFFFLAYAFMIGSWPLLLMEAVLLPVNALRLYEIYFPPDSPARQNGQNSFGRRRMASRRA